MSILLLFVRLRERDVRPRPHDTGEIPLGGWQLSRRRLLGVFAGILLPTLIVGGGALHSMKNLRGKPIPSLLVDPWGRPSLSAAKAWKTLRDHGVNATCRVIKVGGKDVTAGQPQKTGARIYAEVRAHQSASAEIRLDLDCPGRPVQLDLPIIALDVPALWLLLGTYGLAGMIIWGSGLLVVLLAGRRIGAKSYAVMCVTPCIFGLTLLNYHTSFVPWLIWMFIAGWAGTAIGPLWLGVTFPEPAERRRDLLRGYLLLLICLWAGLSAWVIYAGHVGDGYAARRTMIVVQVGASLTLHLVLWARGRRTSGRKRDELDSVFYWLSGIPLCSVGLLLVGDDVCQRQEAFLIALPFFSLFMPLSIGYSIIRHNILDVPVVYSKKIFFFGSGLLAIFFGGTATILLGCLASQKEAETFGILATNHLSPWWLLFFTGLVVSTLLWSMLYQLAQWYFCAGVRLFRPRIEQLNDALARAHDPRQIDEQVCDFVRKTMKNLGVSVEVLDAARLGELACKPEASAQLAQGQEVWTKDDPPRLLLPMRAQGRLRSVLSLTRQERGLYNQDDLVLLRSIASIGAQALDNALHLRELDELRREMVNITRNEKVRALGYFLNEFCHEVGPSLGFMRRAMARLRRGEALTGEDLEILGDEMRRLENMVAGVQDQRPPRLQLGVVNLAERTRRAEHLLRDLMAQRQIQARVEVPEGRCVRADADVLLQILVNLLRNGTQATPHGGQVGVCLREEYGAWQLVVWDLGPGVPEELVTRIFRPGFTTREEGTGWGLFICQRMARDLGFSLTYQREPHKTRFVLHIPPSAQLGSDEGNDALQGDGE